MEQRLTKPKSTRMNVIEQFHPIVSEASDKQHSEETIDNVEIDVMRTEETGKVCRDHWEKGRERESGSVRGWFALATVFRRPGE